MFRKHFWLGIAAVGLTLLFTQDSHAQKGGARGGGGGARAAAPRAAAPAIRSASPAIRPAMPAIHPGAQIHPGTQIHPGAQIHPGTQIHPGSQVLPRGVIAPNALARGAVLNDARFLHNQGAFNHNHFVRHNFFFAPNFFGWGLGGWGYPYLDYGYGYGGYGLGYADFAPYYDYGNYSLPPTYGIGGAFGPSIVAPPATELGAQLDVFVPDPNAQVWFDGQLTASQGMTRYFDSPPLPPGRDFSYTVKAAWTERGQSVVQERTVAVRAGSRVVVDFRQWPFSN